ARRHSCAGRSCESRPYQRAARRSTRGDPTSVSTGTRCIDPMRPPVFDGSVNDPGPTLAVRRQVSAVRRRSNLQVVQHAIALWVAIAVTAATLVVLSAVRGGHGAF